MQVYEQLPTTNIERGQVERVKLGIPHTVSISLDASIRKIDRKHRNKVNHSLKSSEAYC